MFKNQHLLPITTEQQRLISAVRGLEEATVKDIISEATFAGITWIYINLNILVEKGVLNKERIEDETGISRKKLDIYSVSKQIRLKIPYYY